MGLSPTAHSGWPSPTARFKLVLPVKPATCQESKHPASLRNPPTGVHRPGARRTLRCVAACCWGAARWFTSAFCRAGCAAGTTSRWATCAGPGRVVGCAKGMRLMGAWRRQLSGLHIRQQRCPQRLWRQRE